MDIGEDRWMYDTPECISTLRQWILVSFAAHLTKIWSTLTRSTCCGVGSPDMLFS